MKQACSFFHLAIAILLAASCVCAVAQEGLGGGAPSTRVETANFSITNYIASNATTTVNLGNAVKVDNFGSVAFTFSGAADIGPSATALVVTFVRSADNTVWETTPGLTWGITPTLAAFVGSTNIDDKAMGAFGYIKVKSIAGATYGNITNVVMKVLKKRSTAVPPVRP